MDFYHMLSAEEEAWDILYTKKGIRTLVSYAFSLSIIS